MTFEEWKISRKHSLVNAPCFGDIVSAWEEAYNQGLRDLIKIVENNRIDDNDSVEWNAACDCIIEALREKIKE